MHGGGDGDRRSGGNLLAEEATAIRSDRVPGEMSGALDISRPNVRADAKRMMRKPISVVHFTNADALGGAEQHLLTLLRGFDREAFRVALVCPEVLVERLAGDLPADVMAIPLALASLSDWGAAARLAGVLRELRAGVLHSHMFKSSLFASPIGWLAGVPAIIETPHINERWRKGPIKGRFVVDRLAGHFVDRYIAVSEANARYLIAEKGLPAGKVVTIPNSCDVGSFDPARAAPPELRREWHVGDGDPVLVVLARLDLQKGHDVLLDAMVTVHREFPSAKLFFVGEGPRGAALRAQVQDLNLANVVHFTGYRRDVEDWLALADVVVLPSRWEGMPLVAIEALAAGKPIVATAVDGTPEVVVDDQCGIIVPSESPAPLAAAIVRLLREPALRGAFGQNGRQRAEQSFDCSLQVARTERLYLSALEESARRPRWPGRRRAGTREAAEDSVI